MASCEIVTTYPEPQPKPDPINQVVLFMTAEEAGTLKQILSVIGGDPTGPRGVLDVINLALDVAGVKRTVHKTEIYHGLGVYLRIEKGE